VAVAGEQGEPRSSGAVASVGDRNEGLGPVASVGDPDEAVGAVLLQHCGDTQGCSPTRRDNIDLRWGGMPLPLGGPAWLGSTEAAAQRDPAMLLGGWSLDAAVPQRGTSSQAAVAVPQALEPSSHALAPREAEVPVPLEGPELPREPLLVREEAGAPPPRLQSPKHDSCKAHFEHLAEKHTAEIEAVRSFLIKVKLGCAQSLWPLTSGNFLTVN
jgi:hypothetical protein